jgi:alpha-mannosidase
LPQAERFEATLIRLASLTVLPLPAWRYHEDIPHPEDTLLNDENWPVVKMDERWYGPRVLRLMLRIPKKINGYSTRGARVLLQTNFRSGKPLNIFVFSNGALAAHFEHQDMQRPITLTEISYPGRKFLIAVRLDGSQDVHSRIADSKVRIEPPEFRPSPELIRKQLLSLQSLIAVYPEEHEQRMQQLYAIADRVDLEALDEGEQDTFDQSLERAQKMLEVFRPWLKQFSIRAIGHAHIDMAWLWPWTETVEVVRNTFRSALNLIREYPDFRFTMASAQAYLWMEEKYPDLFREIQQRVAEGRWEIVGGMWVEPDLNMPGGESLVRQILQGKRYFQQKFGVDVKIGWNPDTFGYNWQLPQIYRKCGIDYFVTQKMLWAKEFTEFPYKLFWWESPDGSKTLTYFPRHYGSAIIPERMAQDLAGWAPEIYGSKSKREAEIMHVYGVGDHGGGPTRDMLDTAIEWMGPEVVYPQLQFGTVKQFFADLEKKIPHLEIPTWRDELYFEYHRGVFTSQARTKRLIRTTEQLLLNAEKFAGVCVPFGHQYPADDFQRAWRDLLFQQFHDIMPGCGIAINYVDASKSLADVKRLGGGILQGALAEIAARIETSMSGIPVAIFNPLSWERSEAVEIETQLPGPARGIEVVDAEGKKVSAQLLAFDTETNRSRILLVARVPALGYATYFVRGVKKTVALKSVVKASSNVLENEFVRVVVDPQTGCISSLFDKRSEHEALDLPDTATGGPKHSICGNLLQAFRDEPKEWDAWNLDADFENEFWNLDRADEVTLVEKGPLRAALRVKKHFRNSTFVQDIIVTAGSPRVDIHMTAYWQEKHILLKVAFPLSARNDKATFEIPYGTIERPTSRNTAAERGKFEVPAIHWADLSDETHGFSLLNDCKYGYDAKGNVLRLSLLRSPTWPDPDADQGQHEFTYSLFAHAGDWRTAQTVRKGFELNYPMIAVQGCNHPGVLPPVHSFVKIENDNVVLTSLKRAEDSNALIVRFYEWAGKDGIVALQFTGKLQSAFETDLMERPLKPLYFENATVSVPTAPYEIKTVMINYRNI